MALFKKATNKPAQSFGNAPLLDEGSYPARLLHIYDLGLQPGSAQYPKPQHKLAMVFECLDEYMQTEEGADITDQPRTFSYEMSYQTDGYMSDKSTIFKVMTALDGFNADLADLVGRPCLISLVQKQSKDKSKEYNQVKGVSAMRPKDVANARQLVLGSMIFSLDSECTKEDFDQLPSFGGEWSIQNKIKTSLSLHEDAPQLAAALGVEKPVVVVEDKAEDVTYDETVFEEDTGVPVAAAAAEVDPFA